MRRSSSSQANICKCLVGRNSIRKRNARLPVYVGSPRTGLAQISERYLRETYPLLLNDLRESGNRMINPLACISPSFQTVNDYENYEEAMELMVSTLEGSSCQSPHCPNFQYNPAFEALLLRMNAAASFGDPASYHKELERYFGIITAFGHLQGPLSGHHFPRQGLYPDPHEIRSGLGPRIDSLLRDVALRFMPSVAAGGPEAVFRHIANQHSIHGNDTEIVRRLIADLRFDEQWDLYEYAYYMAKYTGSIPAWKMVRIMSDEPVGDADLLRWVNWMKHH